MNNPLLRADGQTATSPWLARLGARLEAYEAAEPSPFLPLILAVAVYAFLAFAMATRPLWHDELYTYYLSKAPTLKRFIESFRVDLQPPLQYALTRISNMLFGDSALATRVPSILAFLAASLCLYHFVQRRLGRFYGVTAMLVLWLTPFLRYAAEARPYALMLAFMSVAMLGWQTAIEGRRRALGILTIGFGVTGMLLSHCFSPILVAVLGLAELVRSAERRKLDWPVWASLIAPTPLVIVYLRLLSGFQGMTVVPPEFQASFLKMITFYSDVLSSMSIALLIALVTGLVVVRSSGTPRKAQGPNAFRYEMVLVLGLLSLPVVVNLLLMRTGGAFWPRYCIASGIGLSLLFVYVLAKLTDGSQAAAGVAAGCLLMGLAGNYGLEIARPPEGEVVKYLTLQQLDSRLPVVVASGITFLEMDHREDASLLARVFYLTDRTAAIHYAHANIFEGGRNLRDYFPIRGTVTPYREFVRRASHFLVLGTPDYPEDWLIPKLMDDGAQLIYKGELRRGYKDSMVFEAVMPALQPGP